MSTQDELLTILASLSKDPLAFVMFAFPWGEPNTDLVGKIGPEPWQRKLLEAVRDGLITYEKAIQISTTSGHGVGKSAIVSWLVWWSVSTCVGARGVVTANTENQLKTKTWVEVNKWYRLFIGRELFNCGATSITSKDPEYERTWRIDIVPWSENNTEAFAGLHNEGKRVIVIFDEASTISDLIWETTEGVMTDANTEILWFVFGNPTKNTGRFRACFEGPHARLWKNFKVDSREVSLTNKQQIASWIDSYGEDSDFVRVRVKGEFPRVGSNEFISRDVVQLARSRLAEAHAFEPLVIGVDVARFGDDKTVICIRKGRDARSIPWVVYQGIDLMQTASRVAELSLQYNADAVFVDEGGLGAGVVDRLRQLRVHCFGVNFGGRPLRGDLVADALYFNKRAEMWGNMRSWLTGGSIPDTDELLAELTGPSYGLNDKGEIQLEGKKEMKSRGVASPDLADALALTFAFPVVPNASAGGRDSKPTYVSEYDPFERAA